MPTFKIGKYTFHRCNVAFHFKRDHAYAPWVVIGVYLTNAKFQNARYNIDHQHIAKAFKEELGLVDSKYIRGGFEFLDMWCQRYHDPLDVISPVINYCTTYSGNLCDVLSKLFTTYVGCCSTIPFAKLAIMIKMREQFFPNLFRCNWDRIGFIQTLRNAGVTWTKM